MKGWENMKCRTGNLTEDLSAREIQSRGGGTGEAPKLRSHEHEDLLIDEFSFSCEAGPGAAVAKLSCSLGVTRPLWTRPNVKL